MKLYLVALAWLASAGAAAANASLSQMLVEASICSDTSLQVGASSSCDPPSEIAAIAIATCQSAWNAIAENALGPPPANGSMAAHAQAVMRYKQSIEIEYTRVAELKTLGIRTAAGLCGFE